MKKQMNTKIRNALLLVVALILTFNLPAQNPARWSLEADGSIKWVVNGGDSHMDHIEMSGFFISAIVHYGVEDGIINKKLHLVFPMLRTIPNNTHGSLAWHIDYDAIPQPRINGERIVQKPEQFILKGILAYQSKVGKGVIIGHQLYPATDQPVFIDKVRISNNGPDVIRLEIPEMAIPDTTDPEKGVDGAYILSAITTINGEYSLPPGESMEYSLLFSARKLLEETFFISPDYEIRKREAFVNNTFSNLVFESPDAVLNRAFDFAKLRAVESIYNTKGGLMHGPGGGRYYAAIWANDQAEYANPFFPFLGNLAGNESAINSFRHFARYMNDDYNPIPSSIIAEGIDYWNGAGDRGDMAMIAYGAARFALAYGERETAKELWPMIEWCLEYCRRKVNSDGVVTSDCDELEFRFPAGDANLHTSCLYYDALNSAADLGRELGKDQSQVEEYLTQSKEIRIAIEEYFGATISGYDTYRYYDGNEVLRAWICTPLTVGIYDRTEGTVDALFSEDLWTADGLATEAGQETFWDRATLYALRGVFAAGETGKAIDYLRYYSNRRLLGDHVPYPVEAYPEGNQRHLSAESALYCRIITEGLFSIRPVGFNAFTITPHLPDGWDNMFMKNINAFQNQFSIEVYRTGSEIRLKVFHGQEIHFDGVVEKGSILRISL